MTGKPSPLLFSDDIEKAIGKISHIVGSDTALAADEPRWLAIKLFERDEEVLKKSSSAAICAAASKPSQLLLSSNSTTMPKASSPTNATKPWRLCFRGCSKRKRARNSPHRIKLTKC